MVHPLGIKEGYTFSSSWITALLWWRSLYNSMKLWAMPCRATPVGWATVESSDEMWSTGGRNGNHSCIQWERPCCGERVKADEEGDRGWDVWMAPLIQWTGTWANSTRWWGIGKSGELQFMGSRRVRHNLVTEQQHLFQGSPDVSVVKNPPASVGELDLIPGSWRCPGEGNGNPPQCSCLGNPMDRRAWWATVHRVAKRSDVTQRQQQQISFLRYL